MKLNTISFTIACIIAGTPLMSQVSTGTMVGTVRDREGKPIVGATVIVTSPNLMASRNVKSDAQGNWRFALLPPGEYRVAFSMDGYRGSSVTGIRVGIDTVMRADINLTPVGVGSATVDITAEATATIDKNSTAVASNYSYETLFAMPVGNSMSGAAYLTPGAVESSSGYVSIRGGMTNASLFRVNGVDIKSDYQGTQTAIGFLADMIEDIQVNVSPLHPRNGRSSGGSMNVVTKSGSNTFSGSIRMVGLGKPAWYASRYGSHSDHFTGTAFDDGIQRDYQITFMGPILKDKLWFSIATRIIPDTSQTVRIPAPGGGNYPETYFGPMRIGNSGTGNGPMQAYEAMNMKMINGPDGYTHTHFDANAYALRRNTRDYYEGKLTYSFLQNHTLEYSATIDDYKYTNRDQYSGGSYSMLSMLGTQEGGYDIWGLSYKGVFGANTFIEARINKQENYIDWPKEQHPTIKDPIGFYTGRADNATGSNGTAYVAFTSQAAAYGKEIRANKSWAVNGTHYWFAKGTHESEFGMERYTNWRFRPDLPGPNGRRIYSGGGVYVKDGVDVNNPAADFLFSTVVWEGASRNGQSSSGLSGPAPVQRRYWGEDGEQNNITDSIYLADLWNITEKWNVLLGFRYDKYKVEDTDGSTRATSSQFIPRAQIKFDPTGDGKHLISLSYALYADDFYTGFTVGFAKNPSNNYSQFGWTGAALNQPLVGDGSNLDALRFVTYQDLINEDNWRTKDGTYNVFTFVSTEADVVDPNLKPTIAHEVSLRYQRQFDNRSTLSLSATQKTWKQLWAIQTEWDPTQWQRLTEPLSGGLPIYSQITRYFNSDDLTRDYWGLEIDYNHIINRTYTLRTGIGYSSLNGNDQGGDAAGDSFRDNGGTPYYNNRAIILRATPPAAANLGRDYWVEDDFANYGYLNSHQLLKGRVTLTARYPLAKGGNLTFVLMGEYDTGSTSSPTTSNLIGNFDTLAPMPTDSSNYPVRPTTFTRFFMPRGSWSGNDHFRCLLNFSFQVPLGIDKLSIFGNLQVNNLFNAVRQTGIQQTWLSNTTTPNYVPLASSVANFGTTLPGTTSERGYYATARNANFSLGLRF